MKKLLKSLRQYKSRAILTPFAMAGEAAMEILIPFVMTLLIGVIEDAESVGTGLSGGDFGKIALYGGVMFVMACFSLACGVLGGKMTAETSAGFAANLREDLYGKIQTFSFENIDKFSSSSLITRITTDVSTIQNAFQMIIRTFVRSPLLFLFASVMSFVIAPHIAWIFLVAAVFLAGIVILITTRAQNGFREMFKKYDKLNSVAQENLTAIRVVKAFVLEKKEIEKYGKATQEAYDYTVRAEKMIAVLMPCVQFVMYATMIILLAVGGADIVHGRIEVSTLTGLLSYSTQILSGVMMFASALNFIAMAKPAVDRIGEILSEESTVENPPSPVCEVANGSIEFEGVSFSYGGKGGAQVLSGIDLKIGSGETVGILGGTGSGKSTLVSLIPRLYDVCEGAVKVGGRDVREYDLTALRDSVAMVLQNNVLFSGSVAENLRWGNENATDEEVALAARQAGAEEFIKRLPGEYEYDLGQGGVNVSGGQKQRLCIARALLKKPKVLILDDSTSAVDTRTDAKIRAALKEHAPEVTKLIIAQRIASVQDADRILVLDGGKVSAFGTHEELMETSEIYRTVYESQKKGGDEDDAA